VAARTDSLRLHAKEGAMQEEKTCPLCGGPADLAVMMNPETKLQTARYHVACSTCGTYEVDGTVYPTLASQSDSTKACLRGEVAAEAQHGGRAVISEGTILHCREG